MRGGGGIALSAGGKNVTFLVACVVTGAVESTSTIGLTKRLGYSRGGICRVSVGVPQLDKEPRMNGRNQPVCVCTLR